SRSGPEPPLRPSWRPLPPSCRPCHVHRAVHPRPPFHGGDGTTSRARSGRCRNDRADRERGDCRSHAVAPRDWRGHRRKGRSIRPTRLLPDGQRRTAPIDVPDLVDTWCRFAPDLAAAPPGPVRTADPTPGQGRSRMSRARRRHRVTDAVEKVERRTPVIGELAADQVPHRPWPFYFDVDGLNDALRALSHDVDPVTEKDGLVDVVGYEENGLARTLPDVEEERLHLGPG